MIKSEVYRGLIYAGSTPLASSIILEQTGPMQLTVRAGTLIDTDGTEYPMADTALDLQPGDRVEIKLGGCWLVLPFIVPQGCTDLAALDIYVLEVRSGYPEGYVFGPIQTGP